MKYTIIFCTVFSGLFISRSLSAKYYGKLIGDFQSTAHDVKGKVYVANENTVVILGFNYDGRGPDAFFWAGVRGEPSPEGFIVPDEEGSTEVLQSYSNKDIVLRLPAGKKIKDLKWLSVWCRKFTANFGYVTIPDNFEPPKEQTIGSLPTFGHGVRSGPLVIRDEKTIFIPDLHYDGAAPDAFFLVGNGTTPTHHGAVKVPYGSGSDPRIKNGFRGENVILTLPDDLTVFNIDWLSMYCITFQENFGHVTFPKDLNVPPVLSQLTRKTSPGPGATEVDKAPSGGIYLGKYISDLRPSQHGVKGSVYAANENTLVIDGFSYDGAGPDAYFWAGATASPTAQGFIVPDEKNSTEVLKAYSNKVLVITLPSGKSLRNIQSFGVWCRRFNADFGHVLVPSNLDIPQKRQLDWVSGPHETFAVDSAVITDINTIWLNGAVFGSENKDVFFIVGNGSQPNERGVMLPNQQGRYERIPYDRSKKSYPVKLLGNTTFSDVEWFSVYCITCRQSYGHALIPKNLNVPPDLETIKSLSLTLDNCEELFPNKLQVSWQVRDKEIYIQLTGRSGDNDYLAFGISGDPTVSKMIGADVTVVYFNPQQQTAEADDYILNAKAQCSENVGVCPIGKISGVTWKRNDEILSVTYKRKLSTGDSRDQIIRIQEPMSVVAAVGPLNSLKQAAFHTKYYNKDPIRIHFGRTPQNNCKMLKETTSETSGVRHWPQAKIKGVTVFRAQIGPTGGTKGYTAITGHQSWGIAWWINGNLIPEITVVRGRNYSFIVEGGSNPTIPASFHPLYITNNAEGGGAQFLKDINSPNHLVYAGLRKDAGENLIQTGVGRLCEFKPKNGIDTAEQLETFEEYNRTLKLDCQPGAPGHFTWMPDENTPNTVYYQCFTHRNLGWKIRVINEDQVAQEENGVGKNTVAAAVLLLCSIATWFSGHRLL